MTHQELLNEWYKEICSNIWERSCRITEDLKEAAKKADEYTKEHDLISPVDKHGI